MVLLTWCANLQPAAGLEDLRGFLQGQAREVLRARGGEEPLGLGLWFPARLVSRLKENPRDLRALEQEFSREGFFLATANLFPMGRFHGEGVKEKVYLPSWASKERLDYTLRAMEVAAVLGRKGEVLPVSTLPLGRPGGAGEVKALLREGTANLVRAAQGAEETSLEEGADLVLSVEPEPGCLLEKAADFFGWFEKDLLPAARKEGLEEVCRRRVGLCLDTCHEAVMGEDPAQALEEAAEKGIRVGKIQLSSALEVRPGAPGWREALAPFDEPVYLHQVTWWDERGRMKGFFMDLPQALGRLEGEKTALWRIHFHLPLFWEGEGPLKGTASRALPPLLAQKDLLPHLLEVETYTWRVLPWVKGEEEIREGVTRELSWAADLL